VQHTLGRVQLERQPALGEAQLHGGGTGVQALPDVGLGLVGQVGEERLPRVAVDPVGRVQQAQRGRRDHRLLDRPVGQSLRLGQVGHREAAVAERARGEPGQLPGVPVGERMTTPSGANASTPVSG
jgi:hypothetical protein